MLPAEQEPVLHVGAVDEVPRHLGQLLGLELAGDLAENPTMPRKSRGNCVEISECSAIATFLAARKLSRIGIDSDRSSISTVLDRTRCSVRSTSKSSGVSRTGRAAARAPDGVADRALDVEVERVAELVGLGLVGALVADAGALELVRPILSLASLREQVATARSGRSCGCPAGVSSKRPSLLLDEAGLLEHLGQLGQPLEAAGGVVAEQLAGPVDVDLGQRARVGGAAQQVLELVEVAELAHEHRAASAKPSGSWPQKS